MNASAFFRNKGARALTALVTGIGFWLAATAAQAMTIERVVSPGGIEAWLVHDSALPLSKEGRASDQNGACVFFQT